nr:transcription factor bye1-like [Aedes albopictus]
MVQCDKCDGWYHYDCVGVMEEVADNSWSCTNCKTATWNQRSTTTSDKDPSSKDTSKEYSPKPSSTQKKTSTVEPVIPASRTGELPSTATAGLQPSNPTDPSLQKTKSTGRKLFVPSVDGLPTIEFERASSVVSSSSSQRSARNRAKLQLQRLEEERAFEEKQEERRRAAEQQEAEKHKAFLDRKYQILEELASEGGSSRRSGSSSYPRSQVEKWIEKGCRSTAAQQYDDQSSLLECDRQDQVQARRDFNRQRQVEKNPAQLERGRQDQPQTQREENRQQTAAFRMSKYFNPNIQKQSTRIQPAPSQQPRTLANSTTFAQNTGLTAKTRPPNIENTKGN